MFEQAKKTPWFMLNRLERVIFKCLQAPFSELQAKGKN